MVSAPDSHQQHGHPARSMDCPIYQGIVQKKKERLEHYTQQNEQHQRRYQPPPPPKYNVWEQPKGGAPTRAAEARDQNADIEWPRLRLQRSSSPQNETEGGQNLEPPQQHQGAAVSGKAGEIVGERGGNQFINNNTDNDFSDFNELTCELDKLNKHINN